MPDIFSEYGKYTVPGITETLFTGGGGGKSDMQWLQEAYNSYVQEAQSAGVKPVSLGEFNNGWNPRDVQGSYNKKINELVRTPGEELKIKKQKETSATESKTAFESGVDNAITSGFLNESQGKQLKDLYASGQVDRANRLMGTMTESAINPVKTEAQLKSEQDVVSKTAFESGVDSALKSGYINENQAGQLKTQYGIDPYNAQLNLNTWTNTAITKSNEPAVPTWQYKEPAYITEAKKIISKEMAVNPQFSPEMVNAWLPTLQQAQSGAKQSELESNTQLMNQMGRLFSGQTVRNAQDVNNRYTMNALNQAMGYAGQDYAQQLANKQSALDKSLALGQYETGLSQYSNQQQVDEALRQLQTNLGNIGTQKTQNFSTLSNAIANMYGTQGATQAANLSNLATNKAYGQQDLQNALNRIYQGTDWARSEDLTKYLQNLTKQDTSFDWTKLLQPAATVGASLLTKV